MLKATYIWISGKNASALMFSAVLAINAGSTVTAAPSQANPPASTEALNAIVGTWQSDVVDGRSARSDCVWTPQHTAVLCEQTITAPSGVRHAHNLFTFEPTTAKYFLYVVQQPGTAAPPVPFAIQGPRWIYGGGSLQPGQRQVRTINDFSAPDAYTWWTESSDDGEHWTKQTGGRSSRVSRPR